MATPRISQAADDLIIASEVSSKAYYDKALRRPEWPGGRSGVTIGIGYDLGYASPQKIRSDWGARLSEVMISAMLPCSGVSGDAARALLPSVKNRIDVPWEKAIDVYENIDIPQWTQHVCDTIPGAKDLPPDCLGALTSLAYNRGYGGFTAQGDRYREMRAIRSHIIAGDLDAVPAEFRSMARLWPDMRGLRIRREEEAKLWEKGLRQPTVVPLPTDVPKKPSTTPPPLELPKPAGAPETGGATGSIVVAGGAAKTAHDAGYGWQAIAAITALGIVAAIIVVLIIRRRRNKPTLANAKG